MSGEANKSPDLRYATNEERRLALAYLRRLAGGQDRRISKPSQRGSGCTHPHRVRLHRS